MLWSTLYNRVARLPPSKSSRQHVRLVVRDDSPNAKAYYKTIWVAMKCDCRGNPYLVETDAPKAVWSEGHRDRRRKKNTTS